MKKKPTTEAASNYNDLEKMPLNKLLLSINKEDQKVPIIIENEIFAIEKFVNLVVENMKKGGRLFYIGAGTSGRLGVLDASECPPTFGVSDNMIVGLIAGGDKALRKSVEQAEDNTNQAWIDLQKYEITKNDVLLGIAASGNTPYVLGGLQEAKKKGLSTGCISCNPFGAINNVVEHPIVVDLGPEFVTGSTRMKSGTAQKLILNMISTAVMIQMGRVQGNKMVDMQLANNKLVHRGIDMIVEALGISETKAKQLLDTHGSVRKAIEKFKTQS